MIGFLVGSQDIHDGNGNGRIKACESELKKMEKQGNLDFNEK